METEYLVCEELAVPIILVSGFIDEFVKRVPVYGASVQILLTVPTDLHLLPSQPTYLEETSARRSQKVRAARRTTLKSGTQTWVTTTAPT